MVIFYFLIAVFVYVPRRDKWGREEIWEGIYFVKFRFDPIPLQNLRSPDDEQYKSG